MRIVLVGGGTGGHFYPLMAVAESLRERDQGEGRETELFYLGPDAYSAESLQALNIKFVYCPAGKKRNYFSLLNYFDSFKIAFGILVAFVKLLKLYPDAVFSKGGYTSVPVTIAASLLRIPVVIHESDAVPGKANKLASRYARIIGTAHDEVVEFFPKEKVINVGMPIRKVFMQPITDPYAVLGITKDRPVILVTGGSSGAERLNDFVLAALPKLLSTYTVLHQVGDKNVEKVSRTATSLFTDQSPLANYYLFGHLSQEKFAAAFQSADLIVSRAGSTTLFEIALNNKPAIVVPIPETVSHDQRSNAYAYARATGAVVLEEHNLSDDILVAEITRILGDKQTYQEMVEGTKSLTSDQAAYKLADILIEIGHEHE